MKFPNQPRAVITGAGSGLGRAMALELAKLGGRILVADINLQGAEETLALVRKAGGDGAVLACDVSKADDLERAAQEADRLWGGTDILINNAGVAAGGAVGEISLADWEWIFRINLWGVIYGCHAFVPRMKKQKSGFIINVASAAGIASLPEMASYNVTKAAVISLSESLFTEGKLHNISVTALCPTFFKTNLMSSFRAAQDKQKHLAQEFFNRAQATAEDVAKAALEGVQKGELYVIPQKDGRLVWRTKRYAPMYYFKKLYEQYTSGVFEKLAKRGERGAV